MLQVQYISACKPGKQIVKVLGAIFVVKQENTKFRYKKSAIIDRLLDSFIFLWITMNFDIESEFYFYREVFLFKFLNIDWINLLWTTSIETIIVGHISRYI